MEQIFAAIIGGLVSSVGTWFVANERLEGEIRGLRGKIGQADRRIGELSTNSENLQKRLEELQDFESKYLNVKSNLEKSSVVYEYDQPVILVGPRAVGKTSLLMQWHSPWNHSRLLATTGHKQSIVPIYDYIQEGLEPHFADNDILSAVHVHLRLKVHDFPGEVSAQQAIIELATEETVGLRKATGKNLGVVLICMLDSSEATSDLRKETLEYYNGELFGQLRELVAHRRVGVERMIFVFNKYDLLKAESPNSDDVSLLKHCLNVYAPVLSLLRVVCNPERVCEVFTVLSREDLLRSNRGAPIVLGEASRNFVASMAGVESMQEVIKGEATMLSAPMFA